jgi:hypothetical protein
MQARDERGRALAAVVALYADGEEGESTSGWPEGAENLPRAAFAGMLSAEEEALVAAVIGALARIVSAVNAHSTPTRPPPPPSAIVGALGGAEMVMRAEIVAGRPERVPELIPGFAYLATLPYLERAEALRLSQRAGELLGVDDPPGSV